MNRATSFFPATSMAQTHAVPAVNATATSSAMPLLETSPDVAAEDSDISLAKVAPRVPAEKSPLPFEEIPGPAILKLWEKYWRYVPLLGTQLFCSLLINKLTQGTIPRSSAARKIRRALFLAIEGARKSDLRRRPYVVRRRKFRRTLRAFRILGKSPVGPWKYTRSARHTWNLFLLLFFFFSYSDAIYWVGN